MLHYLAKNKPNAEFDKFQRQQLQKIKSIHFTADAYFEHVSERLWQEKDYLSLHYDDQLRFLKKKLEDISS